MAPDAFATKVKNYPDHTATRLYFYRMFPVISRELAGYRFKYIETLDHPFPENLMTYVFTKHGGGKYQLAFADTNIKGDARLASTVVEMPIEERDPILNPVELVRCPENEAYLQLLIARGEITIDEKGSIVPLAKPTLASGADPRIIVDPTSKLNAEVAADTTRKLVEYTLETAKQSQKTDLNTMLTLLKELRGSGDSMTPVITMLMQQNAALEKRYTDLMQAYLTQPKSSTGIDGALSLVDKLAEKFGIDFPGSRSPDWAEGLKALAPALIPLGHALASRLSGDEQLNSARQADSRREIQSPPAGGGEQRQPDLFEQLALQVLSCIERRLPGSSLATTIDTIYGSIRYQQICSVGKQGLLESLQAYPKIWQQLEPVKSQVETFIDEFIDWGEDGEEDGDPPIPEGSIHAAQARS